MKKAQANKNDEFYTLLPDIEKELVYYEDQFHDKIVYCNCDSLRSNFWVYFSENFKRLGLKKLIATHYEPNGLEHFLDDNHKLSYKLEMSDDLIVHKTSLKQNGDFRSSECVDLLKTADVVVTNPPFSLFRDFVALLMKRKKKFLVIGNINAIIYKNIFPFIKENKMSLGITNFNTGIYFIVPLNFEHSETYTNTKYIEKVNRVPGICWFTNLQHPQKNKFIKLTKTYKGHEQDYPKYDNYDAINVDKVKDIPVDYDGVMGVPITFLDKYNSEQFEILGCTQRQCHDEVPGTNKYDDYWEVKQNGQKTGSSGSKANETPVLITNDGKKNYYTNNEGRIVQSVYHRIFIKHIATSN